MPGLHLSPLERTLARVVDELALTLLYGMSELCACHRHQNNRETRFHEELTYHSTPDCSKFVSLELLVSSTSRTNTSIVSNDRTVWVRKVSFRLTVLNAWFADGGPI
jgi:hypothetical protein